jgi:S-formylglutathione hydrolase
MAIQTVSQNKSYGGVQGVYKHVSRETKTDMTFSVYVPPHPEGTRLPVVWNLSGLTCTHANVTEKGEFRSACAELGLIFVVPDPSPRGGVPGDPANANDFGLGAGFYVDATQEPFARNYRMWSYVREELPELVAGNFPIDPKRQSVLGHSMGGHGALTVALRHPDRYRAASAFSPDPSARCRYSRKLKPLLKTQIGDVASVSAFRIGGVARDGGARLGLHCLCVERKEQHGIGDRYRKMGRDQHH